MLFNGIILICYSKIKDERTNSAIYHLLTGKKSIQTVQDAHLYDLKNFYGIYQKLNRSHYDKVIQQLLHSQLLEAHSEDSGVYSVSIKGKRWIQMNKEKLPIHYFNGLAYSSITSIFFKRMLLLTQVLTNKKKHYSTYIPVIDEPVITNWIINIYQEMKSEVDGQLQQLHQELSQLLNHLSNHEASLFVERLTGYKNYGMSVYQLSIKYNLLYEDVHLLLVGITHNMLRIILDNLASFPFMSRILQDQPLGTFLTHSASNTYQRIQNGYSLEEIANKRQLKINTVYDHVVEIALQDQTFSIDLYLNKQEQQDIMQAIRKLKSSKLKVIKQHVHPDISYFQIRLVLATMNNGVK